ncbi:MAG: hypothetical protein NC211_08875 [Alistipes senegalensis]|nr:hypothetical protein [Oxalobacter formigenes]MCM1281920.1 hypothetical protein [Alistipes senegalensis]
MLNTGHDANAKENGIYASVAEMADKGQKLKEEIYELYDEAWKLQLKCSDLLMKLGSDWQTQIWSSEDERELLDMGGRKSGVLGMLQSIGRDVLVSVGDVVFSVNRRLKQSELNDLKKEAHKIFDKGNILFDQANALIRLFGFEPIYFNNPLRYGDFELDNSASNGDWGDDFSRVYDELYKALDDFTGVAGRLLEKLGFIEKEKCWKAELSTKRGVGEEEARSSSWMESIAELLKKGQCG